MTLSTIIAAPKGLNWGKNVIFLVFYFLPIVAEGGKM